MTGAASGLGLALTRRLAAGGDGVLATDLAASRPTSLPQNVDYRRLDVRSDASWAEVLAWVTEKWSGLDLLINNAGVASAGRIEVTTMEEWQRVLDINLLGVVRGSRTFAPLLKSQGQGHIVNVASLAGLTPIEGMVAYSTAKAGVIALSDSLGHELAEHGVTVSVVCPFFFQSGIAHSLQGEASVIQEAKQTVDSLSKLSSDDIAAIVVKGINARQRVILTDPHGHILWRLKRFTPGLFRWLMAKVVTQQA